jgi:hypothetical protein
MVDRRLTASNYKKALDGIGGEPSILRVSYRLEEQARMVCRKPRLKVDVLGDIEPGLHDSKPKFFPWRIENVVGDVLFESDGYYDIVAQREALGTSEMIAWILTYCPACFWIMIADQESLTLGCENKSCDLFGQLFNAPYVKLTPFDKTAGATQ